MLFNSFEFLIFFACVYTLYLVFNHRWQNRMLLVASYVFYGFWDWRFLSLILISTVVDYICGIKIDESDNQRQRKNFLIISLIVNLGILGFFKYFNFFTASFIDLLQTFNINMNTTTLKIILPVGISFYTFQTLSYTIDIYRKELKSTKQFFDFALYVAFFPQLVAGPIERAKHLLPQILKPRTLKWNRFREGAFLIFWGLYQKIFIADTLANIVEPIFKDPSLYSGEHIWLATYAFAFQIYCDFAGYSNIARGLGRVMGFDIMVNFNVPYLAKNPREFWHRWHISLSTWLRDYIYIPLGGNRLGQVMTYRNLFIVMVLGGLWHGANWTFVLWGIYHALLLMIHRFFSPLFSNMPKNKFRDVLNIIVFFHLICISWLLFRAESFHHATTMLKTLFSSFAFPGYTLLSNIFPYLYILVIVDWIQYRHNDIFAIFTIKKRYQTLIYLGIIISVTLVGVDVQQAIQLGEMDGPKQFIYFQF